MKNTEITSKIQVKLNQYMTRICDRFSVPVQKFIRDMVFGILKSGDIKLNAISRSLEEGISIKKTSERLGRNLMKENLDKELNKCLLGLGKKKLNNPESYLILDLSDICKQYAKKMEGLALVRDGSTGEIRPGYRLCNVIGISAGHEGIIPLYSELYSIKSELTSENSRILEAINTVGSPMPNAVWVLDRGGDRDELIRPLLKSNRSFIIRQTGQRHLKYRDEYLPLKDIAKKVKLRNRFRSGKNEFECGAIRVKYKGLDNSIWLVVSKYRGGGCFYLLCHMPELFNPMTAAIKALEGYSMRWSIEEVHRHVKVDFKLEDVRVLTYQSLKNLMPLLWLAISFLYVKLKSISIELIVKSKIKVLVKEKLREVVGFIYYKLYKALKFILITINLRKVEPFKRIFKQNNQQIMEF